MKWLLNLVRQGWLAVAIGIVGALILSHTAACESDAEFCLKVWQ